MNDLHIKEQADSALRWGGLTGILGSPRDGHIRRSGIRLAPRRDDSGVRCGRTRGRNRALAGHSLKIVLG